MQSKDAVRAWSTLKSRSEELGVGSLGLVSELLGSTRGDASPAGISSATAAMPFDREPSLPAARPMKLIIRTVPPCRIPLSHPRRMWVVTKRRCRHFLSLICSMVGGCQWYASGFAPGTGWQRKWRGCPLHCLPSRQATCTRGSHCLHQHPNAHPTHSFNTFIRPNIAHHVPHDVFAHAACPKDAFG
jgi:hypothetical protein